MARHIHYFKTTERFIEKYNASDYHEPWLSYCVEGVGSVAYNKDKYLMMPFSIRSLGSGDITWTLGTKTVQYSKNGGEWATMDSSTTISVAEGDEIQFKGTNTDYNANRIIATTNYDVMGNIMSLVAGDDFETADTLPDNAFRSSLFYNNKSASEYGPVNAKNLKLPAMTIGTRCYMNLFRECQHLVSAPELPAMTMVERCYAQMFYECPSLKKAPKLPSTSLATFCYLSIFWGTGIVSAPELPATTLAKGCYENMFYQCASLTKAPELPATTLAEDCYLAMFLECSSLVSAPELLPATTLAPGCYDRMFAVCPKLTTAPVLPATTLADRCYNLMFTQSSSINYVKAMFTTDPSSLDSPTTNWVYGVSPTGTFVKNAEAAWDITGTNGIPEGWEVQTATE